MQVARLVAATAILEIPVLTPAAVVASALAPFPLLQADVGPQDNPFGLGPASKPASCCWHCWVHQCAKAAFAALLGATAICVLSACACRPIDLLHSPKCLPSQPGDPKKVFFCVICCDGGWRAGCLEPSQVCVSQADCCDGLTCGAIDQTLLIPPASKSTTCELWLVLCATSPFASVRTRFY